MPIPRGKLLRRNLRQFAVICIVRALAACTSDKTMLTPAHYSDLPDWASDDHIAPLKLFADSCVANAKRARAYTSKSEGVVGNKALWQNVCSKVQETTSDSLLNDPEAQQFFEVNFTPYHVNTEKHPRALITGYYEPILNGSLHREGPYQTPVYAMPGDANYRRLARADIETGALDGHAAVLLYVDDPVMLFFLHIQGSGKVQLPDGSLVGLQYAGQNGQPYMAIGKVLRDMDAMDVITMQTLRDWLHQHPDQASGIMNQNPSYVYFKLADGQAYAKGALGLSLTPLRSIAVDDQRATYGVPTYISTLKFDAATGGQVPLRRLFVSQDTGGALHGPHRADIFFGRGVNEEWEAGAQNAEGDVYWLLPTLPLPPVDGAPLIMPPAP